MNGGRAPLRAWLLGAIAVGAIDLTDAFVFFGLRGATPIRILQSIASGLLGKASFSDGYASAGLGFTLHFCIAGGIVGVYMIVSRRVRILQTRPFIFGPLYGILVYFIMNKVIVPLSAVGGNAHPEAFAVIANGVLIHMFGVGFPSAWVAKSAAT